MIKVRNPAHALPFTSLQKFALGSAWSVAGQLMALIAVALLARDDTSGALIDQSMATYHSVGVGDSLDIEVGGITRTVTVRGIVRAPEFLVASLNPSLFVSAKGSMGVVYLPPSERQSAVNSVVFNFEPGRDLDTARQAVLDKVVAQNLTGAYVTEREERFSYQYVEKNFDVFGIVIPLMVLVGVLSAAFVSMFLSAQWIARERKSICGAAGAGPPARCRGSRLRAALHVVDRLNHSHVSDAWFNIGTQLSAQPFLVTFGPGLILLLLAALPLTQWVLRASDSDNRERGIG